MTRETVREVREVTRTARTSRGIRRGRHMDAGSTWGWATDFRTFENLLEQAVWATSARAATSSGLLGAGTSVWATGLWAEPDPSGPFGNKRLFATWDTPRLSLDRPMRWTARGESGGPDTPGAPRLESLDRDQVADLAGTAHEATWALFPHVDDCAHEEGHQFVGWWIRCLSAAHGEPIATPSIAEVDALVDEVVLDGTPLVEEVVGAASRADADWTTAASLLKSVVHDSVYDRLRKHFGISGRAVSILACARDLGTTDAGDIRQSFADQKREVPTEGLIHDTLDLPVRFTRLRDPLP